MICGIDEAGRGPVIGPLVVAGVLVESDVPLRQLNVRDSKKLSPERREVLAPEIRKLCRAEILVIPATEIDAKRSEMSLNDFEAKLFATILDRLRPEVAYVDSADVNEFDFRRSIATHLNFEVEIVSKHEADDLFPVVSAASILAKVTRDAEMRKIEEELGTKIGSGYSHDVETIGFLTKWLAEKGTLPPHARASWDTSKRLLSAAATRKLDEFAGAK
ncbi:MAG: ribonuclease HII [Methanobacteriota archaeon]|nr:MAG: ribonuclease HII [Euryarchaeota archaeon]